MLNECRMQFHNFARQIALIQYSGRSMHALPLTKDYKTDHFITRHEENSMMSGLFNQNNLLLCGMQGNNWLLAKTFKKFPKSPTQ